MSRNRVIGSLIFVVVGAILIYALSGDQNPEEYAEYIEKERDEQKRFMQYSDESPFVINKVQFNGLSHFPADQSYKVKARYEAFENPEIVTLSTSDGKVAQYLQYGFAHFEIQSQKQRLLILESAEDKELFLAFGDETSAIETYGAGRYLDIKHNGGKTLTLDFNLAYNPYCAYTDGFTCPFPPKENLLSVDIKAGEKTYK